MNLSKSKIIAFFLAIAVLGWLLYPRELFLAFMYEGREELGQAESYYLSYLEKHPHDRFATLRLSDLYDRMALPEKATPLLQELYKHRKKDWKVADAYLTHLEDMNDLDNLYAARRQVAQNFIRVPHFPVERILFLLESSLQYALWNQHYDEAYQIIDELMQVADKKGYYLETKEKLDRGLKKMKDVLIALQSRLQKNPKDVMTRREIVNVLIALKNLDEAKTVTDESLKIFPDNLPLMESRIFINNKLGHKDQVITDLKTILARQDLPAKERKIYTNDLGYFYKDTGQTDEALKIFRTLLKDDPENAQNWLNVLGTLVDAKRTDEALVFLNEYLEKFPDDDKQRKYLADLYLYVKKDTRQMDFYRDYLSRSKDPDFALDVAYLLNQAGQKTESESWLWDSLELFPNNSKILKSLLGLYLERKDYAKAESLLEDLLESDPKDVDLILDLAQIKSLHGDKRAAADLYDRLLEIQSDALTFKLVGKELFFMGLVDKSEEDLMRAQELEPQDPELWFWLSEVQYYKGKRDESKASAQKAVQGFEAKSQLSPDEKRMLLKAQARVKFTPQIETDYQQAIRLSPKDIDLRSDFIDVQLENKRIWEAQMALKDFQQQFPRETERTRPYELRLALLKRDWKQAIVILNEILSKNPTQWSYRRDLAEAYVSDGQWKKGVAEYEEVKKATDDDLKIEDRLLELHDEYDHQITAGYRFVSLDAEDFMEWILKGNTYLSEDWELKPEVKVGRFDSSSLNNVDSVFQGQAEIANHSVKNWIFSAGAGFGGSPERKTVFPLLGVNFEPLDTLRFSLNSSARKLRLDLPEAVVRGDLQDQIEFNAEYLLLKRVVASGTYEFTRDVLPGGQKSYGHRIEPSLSFIILKDPYISLGYQYTFADQSDENGFLSLVDLIPRMQAHYITAYVAKDIKKRVKVEANAFVGEDTERNLHLFKGDLFGFGTKVRWRATQNLNVDISYDFGRETLTGIGGESHQVGVFLTGHWF